MTVSTQTYSQFVQNAVSAMQGAANQLIDLTVGSILRAFVDTYCGLALWLQAIALQVASLTRFATSYGADADSWGADYLFYRLAAQVATGSVTFSRYTATAQAVIPIGTILLSADGTQQYLVVADPGQSAYNSSLNAYVIAANSSSCTATVNSVTPGSAANMGVGLVDSIGSAIPGVDTVTNPSAFTNGADAEEDPAFKGRFPVYIQGLAKATVGAVESAIQSVQQNIYYSITEDQDYSGSSDEGYFYVVVDDGTGSPSGTFLSTVSNAIDAVRPIGSRFGVFGPSLETANVSMTVTVGAGFSHSVIAPLLQTAIEAYINSLEIGEKMPYTRLAQLAYDASSGVTDVTSMSLNGGTADLTASNQQVIRVGTCVIS